jgi:myxalamid-type polyketide synthase MxaB
MMDVAQRVANLTAVQRQLLEARLKRRPEIAQPIAVVGMACRLPGAANLERYWELISSGRSAFQEIPADRWDVDEFYDRDPDTPGKMATRWCAFVEGVDQFDSLFFGITPREATRMDPQQRMLLEVSWEALEHAGLAPDQLAGTATGVFVGIGGTDYSKIPVQYDNYHELIDAHVGTGNALSIASNRVSYIFDLRGPSLSVDTACSSGMVGLHMAIQSLRAGECDTALAGGVNLILSPEVTIAFSKARMLSATGRCRPFDAEADGYVRGEGCGMLVLKRLTDATREGDNILAVIRASAVNQDGRTSGITAPNSLSQQACIRAALTAAGVDPAEVSYIEAHGTGTPLGDPIEVQSLSKLFPRRDAQEPPCYIASVKANIGHTETVSGIAGLIKVILMMRHGTIPPQAGLQHLNPNINLAGTRLEIPRSTIPWNATSRIAGVSSFGFGGTNTHVVLEAAEEPAAEPIETAVDRPRHILALSARTKDALPAIARAYHRRLTDLSHSRLADFCYSANVGRSHFNQRACLVAGSRSQLLEQLEALAAGKRATGLHRGEVSVPVKPKIAFLFTGQGAQYSAMGRALYQTHPRFRETLDECDAILNDDLNPSLNAVMFGDPPSGLLNETAYTQPALFALEFALARLWQAWGVEPAVMLGHSVGEYVAACLAGVFPLRDGLKLIAKRAQLMQQLPPTGMMAVIFANRERVGQAIAPYGDRVAIATANGPENNVISGEKRLIEAVVADFEKAGIGTQRLTVSHAFHSPLMDPMLDEFEAFAARIDYHRPAIPIVANRFGRLVETADFDAAYWRDHLRNAVEFADGMACIEEFGVHAYLEIGPATSLLGMGRRCVPHSTAAWVPSLRRGRDDWDTLLNAIAELYLLGVKIDWTSFDRPWTRKRIGLPTYPFQRARYWFEGATSRFAGSRGGPAIHPILGRPITTALADTVYETRFSADSPKYLKDHRVQGSIVTPAACYLEQGLAAAHQAFGEGRHAVADLSIQQAMFLRAEGHRVVQLTVGTEMGGRASFQTYSADAEGTQSKPTWTLHASGSIVHADTLSQPTTPAVDRDEFRRRVVKRHSRATYYELMAKRNIVYGPAFQVLGDVEQSDYDALAPIELPPQVREELSKYWLHPALGDALMQMVAGVIPLEKNGDYTPYTYVPVRVGRLRVLDTPTERMVAYAVRTSADDQPSPESVEADVLLFSDNGRLLTDVRGVVVQRVGRRSDQKVEEDLRQWLYDIDWQVGDLPKEAVTLQGKRVILLANDDELGALLADQIGRCGADCAWVLSATEFAVEDPDAAIPRFCIRPTIAEDYAEILHQLLDRPSKDCLIVHLWGLGSPAELAAKNLAGKWNSATVLRLLQQVARLESSKKPDIWLLTRGAVCASTKAEETAAEQAPIWGLARAAAMELSDVTIRLVDLDPRAEPSRMVVELLKDIQAAPDENQIAYREESRLVARLAIKPERLGDEAEPKALALPTEGDFRLRIVNTGSFDGLKYEAHRPQVPGEGQVELEVKAAGLNFSDVLKALGLYPGIKDEIVPLGIECSGIVRKVGPGVKRFKPGDEVLGVAPYSFASRAITADYALVHKPDRLSHLEACTIPIAFLTAYYALVRLANLQPGEHVLIHAGAGGVGLAAIQIAQQIGATIYATAGSEEKREYLHALGVTRVMNSRTLDFAEEILECTGRKGVDVVLNSLPGAAIEKSLSVLRAYGRFLEIGKTDIYSNSKIGLSPFQDNLSYFAIDLDRMLRERPDDIRQMFGEILRFFNRDAYQPLPFTKFDATETRDAFRYMAQRKNIGKVVIQFDREARVAGDGAAVGATQIRPDGTYLITGGLGALGTQVAQWLVRSGARYVALMSRRKSTGEDGPVATLRAAGAEVATVQGDVADQASLERAIGQIPHHFPPLRGVIHAAGLLADGLIYDMDLEQLEIPLRPKIDGTWNLHLATLDQPIDLFVMFSSVAALLGSPGQCNYAAGNAFLDAMAAYRRSLGLSAISINWGPWADAGMAASGGRDQQLAGRGMALLPPASALHVLEKLLLSPASQTAVMSVSWPDVLSATDGRIPPLLRQLVTASQLVSGEDRAEDRAFRQSLLALETEERNEKLIEFFTSELARIMGMEQSDIDVVQPLNTMGLDSLMAIELKNKIERRLQTTLPMSVFLHEPSVSSLASYLARTYGREVEEAEAAPGASGSGAADLQPTTTLRTDGLETAMPAAHARQAVAERAP